jgi:hypothetical protein
MKLSLLALLFLLFSCRKYRSGEGCNTESGFTDVTIIYAGPLESDGFGWVMKTGADQYSHPDGLSAEFRQNELNVKICYELLADKFHCGITGTGIPVIRIIKIKK